MVAINKTAKPIAAKTDNTLQIVDKLANKSIIRRSELETFLRCAASFEAQALGKGKRRISRAAINGTIAHQGGEAFFRGLLELWDVDGWALLIKEGLSEETASTLRRYLQTVEHYRKAVLAVEHEFTFSLLTGAPALQVHFDLVVALDDRTILIVDYKTDQVMQPELVWRQRLQPMLYSVAASLLWPGKEIEFEIGYITHVKSIRWKPNLKQCHEEVTQTYKRAWEEMLVYHRTGVWPERINECCGWCSVKDTCRTLKYAHENFMESLTQIQEKPLVERYLYAKNVLTSIEAKTNELKAEVVEQIQNSGGKLEHGETLLYLYNGKRREIAYSAFASAVADTMKQSPVIADKLQDRYYELLDTALTVRMGVVDSLVAEFPALKPAIESVVTTSASESLTLRVTAKDKK